MQTTYPSEYPIYDDMNGYKLATYIFAALLVVSIGAGGYAYFQMKEKHDVLLLKNQQLEKRYTLLAAQVNDPNKPNEAPTSTGSKPTKTKKTPTSSGGSTQAGDCSGEAARLSKENKKLVGENEQLRGKFEQLEYYNQKYRSRITELEAQLNKQLQAKP